MAVPYTSTIMQNPVNPTLSTRHPASKPNGGIWHKKSHNHFIISNNQKPKVGSFFYSPCKLQLVPINPGNHVSPATLARLQSLQASRIKQKSSTNTRQFEANTPVN